MASKEKSWNKCKKILDEKISWLKFEFVKNIGHLSWPDKEALDKVEICNFACGLTMVLTKDGQIFKWQRLFLVKLQGFKRGKRVCAKRKFFWHLFTVLASNVSKLPCPAKIIFTHIQCALDRSSFFYFICKLIKAFLHDIKAKNDRFKTYLSPCICTSQQLQHADQPQQDGPCGRGRVLQTTMVA